MESDSCPGPATINYPTLLHFLCQVHTVKEKDDAREDQWDYGLNRVG